MFGKKLRRFLAIFGLGIGDGMDGTLATSQDSIHVMEEIMREGEDGSGVDGSGVESLGIGSVMTETLATSQDFYHDTLDFGGMGSGNGSIGGKGVDGNDGSKHTGDTDLFDEDKEDEQEDKEDEEEDKEEDKQEELPLEVLLPGMTFASKADADKHLKEFFNKNYHPFVKVRVIKN